MAWIILNNRNLFFLIEKLKIKVPADLMSGEGLLVIDGAFQVPFTPEGLASSLGLLGRALIPLGGLHPRGLIACSSSLPNTVAAGV